MPSEVDKPEDAVGTTGETTVTQQILSLLKSESDFERAERDLNYARAAVTDLLSTRCLALAEKLGVTSAKDFRDLSAVQENDAWRFHWSEYFRYELCDRIHIVIPAEFIDLSDEEFLSRIDEIALRCSGTSDVKEETDRRAEEQEEKDKRDYERLQKKFA